MAARVRLALLGVALLSARCATTSGDVQEGRKAPSMFPSAEKVRAVAEAPAPAVALPTQQIDLETWSLSGPFPPDHGLYVHAAAKPWDALLEQRLAASKGAALITEGMHCVARNLAELFATRGGYPALAARTYVAGRCRTMVPDVAIQSLAGDVPDSVTDEALYAQWQAGLQKMIGPGDPGHPEEVGLALVRRDGKAAFIIVRGERRAHVQSVQRVAGEVVVEGHLLVSDAVIRASVNVGDVGFAACVADLSLQIPRFRMRCPVSPADPQTWIQMASFPPGRYLGRTALNLLVAPGEPSDVYARRKLPGTDAEVTQQTLTARFLEAVNAVRASAGLPALQLEAAQSELASRLAPHYFDAAQVRLDPARADLIYLGLRAGWEVSGMVRYGLFGSSLTVGSRSLRFLVDDLLDLPLGREALLDPAVDRVALGAVWSDEQVGMGVLFSTYAMFGQDDPAKLAVQVRAHLNASRARAGRGPVGSLSGLADDDGTGRASTLLAEGQAPGQALRGVMGSASRVFAAAVQGYYITTDGVDHLEWPEELLLLDRVDVQISVGWHQPPDEPWGSYVVFVVYPSRGVEI